jgi:MFS family permease
VFNLRQARSRTDTLPAPATATEGMLQSLRVYPAFRLLLLGTLATNTAFWMYQVALGWVALQMSDSPFFVGLAGFMGGIPLLLFSLPVGVISDRFDRRTVLLFAQFGIMIVAGLFAILIGTGMVAMWSLLALAFTYGTVMSFIFPTRTAIVPSLVGRGDLANAVALNSAAQNATRVVGPSLAGILIAGVGVPATFAIASAMQILALFWTWRLPPRASERFVRGALGWRSLTTGLHIVANDPLLVALIALASIPTVLVMPYINLMPVFARDILGLGSSGLGLLLASTGLGTVAGALSVARSPRARSWRSAQLITAAGFAVMVLLFAVTPVVSLAVLLLFVAGWMSATFLAINQTTLQLSVEDSVRGRVLSIYLLTWGMLPLGQLAVGAFADHLGTPAALVVSCSVAVGCIGLIAWRFPSLRA